MVDFTEFMPRASFSFILNMFHTREKVEQGIKLSKSTLSIYGELSPELTGTSNSVHSSRVL